MPVQASTAFAALAALATLPGLGMANGPASDCCNSLTAAGLKVLSPDSGAFGDRVTSYWSISAQLDPWCIVMPQTTQEVSTALTTLLANDLCNIAVRSGGHTTWAGANNIADGVTIDLGDMNGVTFHPENTTASILPGSRWLDVYQALDKVGYTVPGGRAGTVGVAGLILGGGNSFFSAERGMVCDQVVRYEVVLASGDIIYATADENADLFRALKGGSANFGIVTRFDMNAFKAPNVWGGVNTYNLSVGDAMIDAFVAFVNNIENDMESSSIIFWTYQPRLKDIIIIAAYENTAGIGGGPSFDEYMAVPDAATLSSTMRVTNMSDLAVELEQPGGYRDVWQTLTFKNDQRVIHYAVDRHAQLVRDVQAQLGADADFITQCMFQPMPTIFAKHSTEMGGNMLGMNRVTDNAVLFLATLAVKTLEQEDTARKLMVAWRQDVGNFARSIDALVEWVYLNYADYTQNPLASYGAENVGKIAAAAAKYDPNGVFQTRIPGGFKVSLAGDGDNTVKMDVDV